MEVKFELLDDLLIRFFFLCKCLHSGARYGYCDPGHGDLEERCLVKKKEGTAGGVLGGGFLSRDEKGCLGSGEEDRRWRHGRCLMNKTMVLP